MMFLLCLAACQPTVDPWPNQADDVHVISPINGESVTSPFLLTFEAGADVDSVRLDADGSTVVGMTSVDEAGGELTVSLSPGRRALTLVGLDAATYEISEHALTVRVLDVSSESWLTIMSPPDGSTVPNPVSFLVNASSDIDTVEIFGDGWTLGTTSPGETLTYKFAGTGYERKIEAVGSDDGVTVATDTIAITVEEGTSPPLSQFNDYVTAIQATYPTDGTHDYYWPSSGDWPGTTQDIWYLDTLVAEGDPEGRCYCVGITWEVYMRAFDEVDRVTGGDGSLNGLSVEDLYAFRTDWFVEDLWGAGAVDAMEIWGLGEPVTNFEDLRPGDFVQFWRPGGSGHSVIFDAWIRDDSDQIEGLQYWSCQSSTDGIGLNTEYFGSGGSDIDPSFFFTGRGWMPEDWMPWEG